MHSTLVILLVIGTEHGTSSSIGRRLLDPTGNYYETLINGFGFGIVDNKIHKLEQGIEADQLKTLSNDNLDVRTASGKWLWFSPI